MNDQGATLSAELTVAPPPKPPATRTGLMPQAPIFLTLPRLVAPNVLNLPAIVGMITFDGMLTLSVLAAVRSPVRAWEAS